MYRHARLQAGHARVRATAALLLACALGAAAPAGGTGQRHRWRIAVAGPWATGYMGPLGRLGLPRERLQDAQVADPALLAQYDVLFVSYGLPAWPGEAQAAVEAWVRRGGVAIVELGCEPSQDLLAHDWISPRPGTNLRLAVGAHRITEGLPATAIRAWGVTAAAVLPRDEHQVAVLARYTDEGAPAEIQGQFVRDGAGVPAVVMRRAGTGTFVYSGPYLSSVSAYAGPELEQFLVNLLRFVSDGDLVPRFTRGLPEDCLAGRERPPYAPRVATSVTVPLLPQPYALVEANPANLGEYTLSGTLVPNAPADVLLDYAGPEQNVRIQLGGGQATVSRTADGRAATLYAGPFGAASGELLLERRERQLTQLAPGAPPLVVADGLGAVGAVATSGLADVLCQPVGPIAFGDDFMRQEGEGAPWRPVSGDWRLQATEGRPETGSNPFSYGVHATGRALSVAGQWFWDGYAVEASARWRGHSAGLCACYRDSAPYVLLRATQEGARAGRIALLRVAPEGERVLTEASVELAPWQWYRLGLRVAGGLIVGAVDGREVVTAADEERGCGAVGLYAEDTEAVFDDVAVSSRHTARLAGAQPPGGDLSEWVVREGQWQMQADPARAVASVDGEARLETPWRGWGDCRLRARMRGDRVRAIGLGIREAAPAGGYRLVLRPDGRARTRCQLLAWHDGKLEQAADAAVTGGLAGWHDVGVTARGEHLLVTVDGAPTVDLAEPGPAYGPVVLQAEGKGTAEFADVLVEDAPPPYRPADPPPPPYAGAVDRQSWAEPASSWFADPADLGTLWHTGSFPQDVAVRVGVHRGEADKAAVEVLLGDGPGTEPGDVLRVEHDWGTPRARVRLTGEGRGEATASGSVGADDGAFLLELERCGEALVGRVNGEVAVVLDRPPRRPALRVGVRAEGTTLWADDLAVEAPTVRTYTFAEAPVDWFAQCGRWEIAPRWSCSPEWTWLAGSDPSIASIRTKERFVGDVRADCFVAAQMFEDADGLPRESLSDIRLGLCGDGEHLNAGYTFLVGMEGNTWTALQRDGRIVARDDTFRLPVGAEHNDWTYLTVEKQGSTVRLFCYGQPVLAYDDPEPIGEGYVSMGTQRNGIVVPRVTIYGTATTP